MVIAISYGGESPELVSLLNFVARRDVPLIAMTANAESSLGRAGQVVLDIAVKEEACPLRLAPTSSSTATLAMGDALAMAVLKRKGFRTWKISRNFHPGGKLGKKLLTRVKRDVMHTGDAPDPLVPLEEIDLQKLVLRDDVKGRAWRCRRDRH